MIQKTIESLRYEHTSVSDLLLAFCGNLQLFGSAEKDSHQRPEVPGPGVILNYMKMIKSTKHHSHPIFRIFIKLYVLLNQIN